MASPRHQVKVGKRTLELSNLEKVLYPRPGYIKAQVIEYYLKAAPTLLTHIKDRPLSLIRMPDGVDGERFFQKNLPKWAPPWLESEALGKGKKKDYLLATEPATIVWIANMAGLEIHQGHARRPHLEFPDYFVFDLDPPEGADFKSLIELAHDLRDHIESYDYHCFVKTSGGKGLHIFVPIEARWSFDTVFEHSKEIAQAFVKIHSGSTTLNIKKDARKGRVLIDIYRNRASQTIISPYSLRGNQDATVSMPLTWEELGTLESPLEFNLESAGLRLDHDPWQGFAAFAVPLHHERKEPAKGKEVSPGNTYKTPEQLQQYAEKRSFVATPEPPPYTLGENQHGFVIHRHDASRLHYDLRLEQDGVLRSWAIPRGMPGYPGLKRLAVSTENHPIEYLNFEGQIPRGQYGGGNMWIYALGKYEITKTKKNGFYFRLSSPQLSGEYRMHQTGDREWLLERVDEPQVNWLNQKISPMLAEQVDHPPEGDEYLYEVKWDGIRALIHLDEDGFVIRTRNHNDITEQFPELNIADQALKTSSCVLDAEIVCLDPKGRSDFRKVIHRMQRRGETNIELAARKSPAYCYVFDCLYLDGRSIMHEPLERRRSWIKSLIRRDTPYRLSQAVNEGPELFKAAEEHGLEGIMAKDRNSSYYPGKRSGLWLKVKVRKTATVSIIGYTQGKGGRKNTFGALQIAESDEQGSFHYRGKVGTGFTDRQMDSIKRQLSALKETDKYINVKPIDAKNTVWVEPTLVCEVQFASLNDSETFREPVFIKML